MESPLSNRAPNWRKVRQAYKDAYRETQISLKEFCAEQKLSHAAVSKHVKVRDIKAELLAESQSSRSVAKDAGQDKATPKKRQNTRKSSKTAEKPKSKSSNRRKGKATGATHKASPASGQKVGSGKQAHEGKSQPPAKAKALCGARTRSGGRCKLSAGHGTNHPGTGRCKRHGGASTGAPRQNQNARTHGVYSSLGLTDEALEYVDNIPDDELLYGIRDELRVAAGQLYMINSYQTMALKSCRDALNSAIAKEADPERIHELTSNEASIIMGPQQLITERLSAMAKLKKTNLDIHLARHDSHPHDLRSRIAISQDLLRLRKEYGLSAIETGQLMDLEGVPVPQTLQREIDNELRLQEPPPPEIAGGVTNEEIEERQQELDFKKQERESLIHEREAMVERLELELAEDDGLVSHEMPAVIDHDADLLDNDVLDLDE